MVSKTVVGALALAGGALTVVSASAGTVYLGYSSGASPPPTSPNLTNPAAATLTIGSDKYTLTSVGGTDSSSPGFFSLFSQVILGKTAGAAQTLTIYVADTGNLATSTAGVIDELPAALGVSFVPNGWTLTESEYLVVNNSISTPPADPFSITGGILIGAQSGVGSNVIGPTDVTLTAGDYYSIIDVYKIVTSAGKGSANANANISLTVNVVPEPSTWVMLLFGFVGLGVAGYRSRKASSVASRVISKASF